MDTVQANRPVPSDGNFRAAYRDCRRARVFAGSCSVACGRFPEHQSAGRDIAPVRARLCLAGGLQFAHAAGGVDVRCGCAQFAAIA